MGWPCGSVSPANPLQLHFLFRAALPASGTCGRQVKPVPEALPPAALARPDEGGARRAAGGDMGLEFLLGWFLGGPARPG